MTSTEDERWAVLDLFSGLGGFSSAFEGSDRWDAVRVDIEEQFSPDIRADVFELRPDDLPDADVVLASPPCKTFSKAANWHGHHTEDGPQTETAREHVALVFHTLGLIEAIAPEYWFLENPEGHLKKYLGHPTARITFCQYGREHRKPTDLWGVHPPTISYRRCSNGDPCHQAKPSREEEGGGNHPAEAMPNGVAERAKVPKELSESIRAAVDDALENPQPEQQTLVAATDGGETTDTSSTGTDRSESTEEGDT